MNGKILLPKMQFEGSMFRTNHYLAVPINPPTESPSSQYRYQRLNHLMDTFLASRQDRKEKDKNEVITAIIKMLRDTKPGHPSSPSSPMPKTSQNHPQTILRSFQKQSWSKRTFEESNTWFLVKYSPLIFIFTFYLQYLFILNRIVASYFLTDAKVGTICTVVIDCYQKRLV